MCSRVALQGRAEAAFTIVAAAIITARTSSTVITVRCWTFDDLSRASEATFDVADHSGRLGERGA